MRVLVIEDEPRMLELLRQGLYEQGFTVMTASDGEAGLDIATSVEPRAPLSLRMPAASNGCCRFSLKTPSSIPRPAELWS
jgi:DNA-binding response OmpR family regulator